MKHNFVYCYVESSLHTLRVCESLWVILRKDCLNPFHSHDFQFTVKKCNTQEGWPFPDVLKIAELCVAKSQTGLFLLQGCISCGTCSYPELTEDHVLTSAYVKIFRTVTRNAVNKGVWRKKRLFLTSLKQICN